MTSRTGRFAPFDRGSERRRTRGRCAAAAMRLAAMALVLALSFVMPQANRTRAQDTSGSTTAASESNESGAAGETGAATETASDKGASAGKIFASKSLLQIVRDGGLLMIPIGICSIVLMVFVFERSISLRKGRIIPRPFVNRFLEQLKEEQLDPDSAMALCTENRSPVSEVFAAAIQKWDRPSVEIEQAIIDSGERVANSLRRYLRLINGIATVTPLLGLLGTVLGMIQAFDALGNVDGAARPELLIAGGISQALLTTAAGLGVAIPALIAYLFFVGRVDQLVIEIDSLGQRIVGLIACDAWRPSAAETTGQAGKKSGKERRRAA